MTASPFADLMAGVACARENLANAVAAVDAALEQLVDQLGHANESLDAVAQVLDRTRPEQQGGGRPVSAPPEKRAPRPAKKPATKPAAKKAPKVVGGLTCPECGKSFTTAQARGAHRARAHGFRRPGKTTEPATSPPSFDQPEPGVCTCLHGARRHEDGVGMCNAADCECSSYAGAA